MFSALTNLILRLTLSYVCVCQFLFVIVFLFNVFKSIFTFIYYQLYHFWFDLEFRCDGADQISSFQLTFICFNEQVDQTHNYNPLILMLCPPTVSLLKTSVAQMCAHAFLLFHMHVSALSMVPNFSNEPNSIRAIAFV